MRKEVEKEVVVERERVVEVKCDVCGVLIADEERYYAQKYLQPAQYFYACKTWHRDWGNDSVDSIQHIDCCSDECLKRFFDKYLQDKSYTINFEFERTRL